jgi:hypothetical protein
LSTLRRARSLKSLIGTATGATRAANASIATATAFPTRLATPPSSHRPGRPPRLDVVRSSGSPGWRTVDVPIDPDPVAGKAGWRTASHLPFPQGWVGPPAEREAVGTDLPRAPLPGSTAPRPLSARPLGVRVRTAVVPPARRPMAPAAPPRTRDPLPKR